MDFLVFRIKYPYAEVYLRLTIKVDLYFLVFVFFYYANVALRCDWEWN